MHLEKKKREKVWPRVMISNHMCPYEAAYTFPLASGSNRALILLFIHQRLSAAFHPFVCLLFFYLIEGGHS